MNGRTSLTLCACAVLFVGVALALMSCKSSDSAAVKPQPANLPPITGKQWRLAKEWVAADNKEDYVAGSAALRQFDAFGAMEVSRLFYHHNLVMVPAGTLVGETGPDENGAHQVRALDGPLSGQTLWLYPESAEKMGFPAPTPSP